MRTWLRIKWDTAVIVAAGAMLALLTYRSRRLARKLDLAHFDALGDRLPIGDVSLIRQEWM